MAVLAAILPIVSRSSALAVHLYSLAAVEADTTKDLLKTAKYINNVSLIVKQLGTIIKEDDRLPSSDAFEILEDILSQCTAILSEIENIFPYGQRDHNQARRSGLNSSTAARLQYLLAHLDALRSTLAVMLQTLYTAQSIMWTRVRPTVSLAQCATAVANEKQQLETLIIEQQMSILRASKLYEPSGFDTRLLMEQDSAQSLVALETDAPQPSNLFKYQDKFIASLDIHNSDEAQWLLTVCSVSKSQLERLLDRWTRLRQFEESLREEERKAQAQKRESQQPFVESDSEDDICSPPRSMGNDVRLATSTSHRPGSTQIHMSETVTLPIPVKKSHGPHAPSSPASSYGATASLGNNPPIPVGPAAAAPVTPRSSITTLPVEAAAAIEAKDKDDEIDLEIPWTLCTRRHYWKYIDGTVQSSNTDAKPSEAFSDRNSWTEILASWVCKEAIQEEGYKFTQVQKERRDGRRTRFETCFCIEQPLRFEQVRRLVERTVEIYRKTQPPTPPSRPRPTSFEKRPGPTLPPSALYDRERTPIANGPPPLERSYTAYPPPPPPPLDRTSSMPGPTNPRMSSMHLPPLPTAAYPIQPNPYPPQSPLYTSPQAHHPPQATSFNPRHLRPHAYPTQLQSPQRQSFSDRPQPQNLYRDSYSSTSGTSDSDSVARPRKHRSKSRRRDEGARKKKDGHSGATKAMMGVAGLTALLDGLVGI